MSLKSEIQAYLDPYGLVLPRKGDRSSDNGVLFTSQYYLLLARRGELDEDDAVDCFVTLAPCFRERGLLTRRPGVYDQEGPDDHIGICAAAKVLKLNFANEICDYGESHFPPYLFNTPEPEHFTTNAWLGRQLGLVGWMKHCAGRWVNPFYWLILFVGFYLTSRQPDRETSDRILSQLMVDQLPDNFIHRFVKDRWRKHIVGRYGSRKALLAIYFGSDHPLVKYEID